MISPEIQYYLKLAEESHEVAKTLMDFGHVRFSAAQSYYTFFYLAQAMLLSKGLTFSSHSAVVAVYGKEFAKSGILDSKFHRFMMTAQQLRQIGHYGDETEEVTKEQASDSFHRAEEFMQAVKNYLGT